MVWEFESRWRYCDKKDWSIRLFDIEFGAYPVSKKHRARYFMLCVLNFKAEWWNE